MGASYSNDCYVLQVHHHPAAVSLFSMSLTGGVSGWGRSAKGARKKGSAIIHMYMQNL